MKLTDKKAISIYKRLKCAEARESIEEYPDDERDGRSDLEFIADEVSYFRSNYEEDGCAFKDALEWARECLRDTKNGKIMPVNVRVDGNGKWHFLDKYKPSDVDSARWIVAEYKQLNYYDKKLKEMGYYGTW